jgi:tetratricopeptide (TPR) repeat protein
MPTAQGTMRRIAACLVSLTAMVSLLPAALAADVAIVSACEPWVAKLVSAQGVVEVRRTGTAQWQPVQLDESYCAGDMVRVLEHSRAAVVLRTEVNLRLEQHTTITFVMLEQERTSFLDLLIGAVYSFSRVPRSLRVRTPFVNAAIEGTEFFVKVERDEAFLSVFAGQVAAMNEAGSLTLTSGQAASARAGQAPMPRMVVRPRDAVQWALYYPPILDYRPTDFANGAASDWQAMVRKSIQFYREGDLAMAFASIAGVPEDIRDARFLTYRAVLLLSVGRVEEAQADIARALRLEPRHSPAFAVQAVIAVTQNDNAEALRLAQTAVALEPASPAARVALSYAQQAEFDLKSALTSLQEAVNVAPDNALAWARLAELWLSVGDLNRALKAAQQAAKLHPNLGRTQSVLGFAYLTQIKTADAKKAFESAIQLDQADPLPRLGLGLAKIRESALEAGRGEIEIAVSLDPNNALARSYLGKAYYEEKRDRLAGDQFAIAKALDPKDPTPWFYDAIRKQSINRPVEALQDLQTSIELNDNRAVYRSRLLLDEDLAARSASLARIYDNLGFQQLALVEGWKSLHIDPSNYSAHRFLADSYAALPRHEIARVSELLQSQLLQPINIAPVQPQLAESELRILEGAGPAEPSLNEFNPLFFRNRIALLASAIAGGNATIGDELVVSGVWGRVSYSLSQFHYETDGFRQNNDLKQDIYEAFAQVSLSHKTSVQAEFRQKDFDRGDLPLRFDPNNFNPTLRQKDDLGSIRLGLHHAFTPRSDIIASVIYRGADFDSDVFPGSRAVTDEDGYVAEVQHLFRLERFHVISGIGNFSAERRDVIDFSPFPRRVREVDVRHSNLYVYSHINYPKNVTWTIGASADFFEDGLTDRDQFNPKLGLSWTPLPATTLRAAVSRALKRALISDQTVEPTQVAGFNQFFDDPDGTESWRYGIGIDQKFSAGVYGGVEFARREMEVPFFNPISLEVARADWEEDLGRAYLYWTPQSWLALSAEYQYERHRRGPAPALGVEAIAKARTYRVPLGVSFFHSSGFRTRLKATYLDQAGRFLDPRGQIVPGDDQFWVVDASIGYRLPKRWGLITIGVRNLINQGLNFQDTDPSNPTISPERLIFGRLTLAF